MKNARNHNEDLIEAHKIPASMRIRMAPLSWTLSGLSHLPLPMLYPLADVIGFLARTVARYRRRIVTRNIADSFPELSEKERRAVRRRFYRRLGDYFVETLKLATISDKELKKRMVFENTELVDKYLSQGREIVIYTSHFGNWEWITSMGLWCRSYPELPFAHLYRPLKQPWFDRWWLRLRGRYNHSIPMKGALRRLLGWRKEKKTWITGFLSDQKPSHAGTVREVEFLGRKTPFIYGTEELARKLNAVVLLFDTEVTGRGRYKSTIRLITDNPSSLPDGEITRQYAENLTAQIRRSPEAYLWSHNRWRLPRK